MVIILMRDRMRRTISQYDKIAAQYSQNIAALVPHQEIDTFKRLVKPGGRILDVGCAVGRDTRIFKDAGFEVVGIDLSTKLLDIARENNPDIVFQFADIRRIPFPDESFGGLWVNAVFHHLEKEEMISTLKELNRIWCLKEFCISKQRREEGFGKQGMHYHLVKKEYLPY